MKSIKVRITFTVSLLGTSPADPEIHDHFIASKAPDAKSRREEVAAIGVDEAIERGKTIFPKMEDGTPFLWDYQVRGFIKETLGILYQLPETKTSTDKSNYFRKKKVDNFIFVEPRQIPLWLPIDLDLTGTDCQRPLRASTPQGERVALAHSEEAPAGTYIECTIECLQDKDMDYVLECLDYGKRKGMCQWRNSGHGRFTYEVLETSTKGYLEEG